MFDQIDPRHLRYIVALAETGSFTRASELLHVAQPAVSQAISRLERQVGLELFDRRARRLTEAGQVLAARGSRIRAELEAARSEIERLTGGHGGRIRLGAIHWIRPFDLPGALAEFHRRYPEVELDMREDDAIVMLRRLQAGELDVVIHNAGPDTDVRETARRVLATERIVVAVGPEDPWADRKRVAMAELAGRRVITFRRGSAFRNLIDRSFADHGHPLDVAFESSDLLVVGSLAAAGLGPAIVPKSVAEASGEPLHVLDLIPGIERRVVLVWRTDHVLPPHVESLLDVLHGR